MVSGNCCGPGVFHGPLQCFVTLRQQWVALLPSQQPSCQFHQHSPGMKKGGQVAWVWPYCVVIGNGEWQLLPSWCVPWTLAMFCKDRTTMVDNGWPSFPYNSQFANSINTLQG